MSWRKIFSSSNAENVCNNNNKWPLEGSLSRLLTQRERNRKAANKSRAKTKASTGQLATDEREMADVRKSLSAEVTALRQEALRLRMLVLQHHGCACAELQAYIRNSAGVIGQSGGRASLFGPDGCGCPADPGQGWVSPDGDD